MRCVTQRCGRTAHWEMQPRLAPCSCSAQAPCRQQATLCKLTATHTEAKMAANNSLLRLIPTLHQSSLSSAGQSVRGSGCKPTPTHVTAAAAPAVGKDHQSTHVARPHNLCLISARCPTVLPAAQRPLPRMAANNSCLKLISSLHQSFLSSAGQSVRLLTSRSGARASQGAAEGLRLDTAHWWWPATFSLAPGPRRAARSHREMSSSMGLEEHLIETCIQASLAQLVRE